MSLLSVGLTVSPFTGSGLSFVLLEVLGVTFNVGGGSLGGKELEYGISGAFSRDFDTVAVSLADMLTVALT